MLVFYLIFTETIILTFGPSSRILHVHSCKFIGLVVNRLMRFRLPSLIVLTAADKQSEDEREIEKTQPRIDFE